MSSKKKCTYSRIFRFLLAFILAIAMVFVSGGGIQSLAASGMWTGAFSNIWNHSQNWMPGGYPNASGEIAVFDGGDVPTHVVISKEQVTAGSLVLMNNIGYTISQEMGGSLNFQSASSFPATAFAIGRALHTVSAPVLLSSNLSITNYASGNLTFSGNISEKSGGGGFSVDIRAGRPVVFLGANSYSAGTQILGGTLLLGGNTSAGSGTITLLCSSNPCDTPEVPASIGNKLGDTVLQNLLEIRHSYVQFLGLGSMSFTSLDSSISASAKLVITGTLNLAKLQDPTGSQNLRRSGSGTLNLNITPLNTNIGDFIRSDPGSGQMNLYGSGNMGRIYYRDGSGGGVVGVGDNLDVTSGVLTHNTGVLTITGVLQTGTDTSNQPDRVLSFDLRGMEPGIGYDQIVITELNLGGILSTARITDTVLSVAVDPNFDPPVGSIFTLIHRTGGDGTPDDVIHGTFRGLPDGTIFHINDLPFQIDYTSDVVTLTRCMDPILEVVIGTPQSTTVGTQFPQGLAVHARYPNNSPVVGLPIYFSAPASGASATFAETIPVTTDSQGNVVVTATANMTTGSYQVIASVLNPNVAPVVFELTNLLSGPDHLVLSDFPSSVRAGETRTFTVTVRDPGNQLITDYTGTLAFTSSDPQAALPENYTFTLADAGQHTFSATFYTAGVDHFLRAADTTDQTLTGEQTGIIVLPADPSKITILSGSSQTTQVGTPFADPLVIQVTDAYSNATPGHAVTFTSPVIGAGAVFTGTNPLATDLNGQANLVVGANTIAGGYQVTASVETPGVSPAAFTLTNLPGPVVSLNVFGFPSPVFAGTTHPFTVNAIDKYGNINPSYRGSTYSLSSDMKAILPQDYLFTALDAGSHIFNATFKTAGTHYLTIVDNHGPRGTQSGIVVEPIQPAILIMDKFTSQTPQSAQVGTTFLKPLAVILTDLYGNPQSGYTITFTVPSLGASAMLAGESSQLIGNDGRASVIATANTIAGSYEVLVTTDAPGVAPFMFALTNLPGTASSVTYESGSMQETSVEKPFTAPLVVRITDLYGNPVQGVWVTYTCPISGPSCVLANGGQTLSGMGGLASLTAAANQYPGIYQVEARLVGVADPALFTLANRMYMYLPGIAANFSGQ